MYGGVYREEGPYRDGRDIQGWEGYVGMAGACRDGMFM